MRVYWLNPWQNTLKLLAFASVVGFGLFWVISGFSWHSHWEQVESRKKLTVAVRESEGIYWANGQEFTGLEHDLIQELEQYLGLPIQIFAVQDLEDLYQALNVGAVDMAIPGTSISNAKWPSSIAYSSTRIGLAHPRREQNNLSNYKTGILDPYAHEDAIQYVFNSLSSGTEVYKQGSLSAELFTLLEMSELDQVLIDERDFKLQQAIFPKLQFTPLNLPERNLKVLFNPYEDGSLKTKINEALELFEANGQLTQMADRYLGQALEFDYVDNLTFEKHMAGRLPKYKDLFQKYALEYDLDWRLLAAVAYQESHWRESATSPTGVRGLMMITLATAQEIGISNRLDPEQSTRAGAQYLSKLKSRVPPQITEPDRTWFALASYNVGAGHVEDARKITEIQEGDPNRWIDVRKHLPKLALKDYYPWTKHGYARGKEPVVYVANIRRFYNRLKMEFTDTADSAEPERLEQLPSVTVPVFIGHE